MLRYDDNHWIKTGIEVWCVCTNLSLSLSINLTLATTSTQMA